MEHMFLKSPQRCTIIMFSFPISGCRSLLFIMLVLYVLFTAQCVTTCHDFNARSSAVSQGNVPPTSTYIKSHNPRLFMWLLHTSFDTLRLTYLTSCLIYVPLSLRLTLFSAFFFCSFSFSLHWVSAHFISPLLCLWLVRFTLSALSCSTSPLTLLLHDHPITNNMLH